MSRRTELVFAVFMVSGFGGLIYESVWSHYLQLFLGHAAYAQTLVLMVFIGGLSLGSWICARLTRRVANPLRWYAAVELAIGVIALVFHPLFVSVTGWAYATLLPATCDAASPCATQWLLSTALLLPQSVLLGATFPLVTSAVLRMDPDAPGHHVAMLYFVNSLGAVFGVLASAFVLIPAYGLPGTLAFAGSLNVAIAAAAFALALQAPAPFAVAALAEGERAGWETGRRLLAWLLATALLTGLSSFIYEIVWIRMLSLVLGASTYSFELMLASFILGIALGGLWIRGRIDAVADPVRFLGIVQIVMGVAAAATLPIYDGSFDFMAWLLSAVARNNAGFVLFNLGSVTISLLVMLPATFCAGMTLPLITYRLVRSSAGERAIGLVYSANTLGSIAGVIVAVHLLMTHLGLRGALLTGAAIDVLLGVVLVAVRSGEGPARWRAAAPIALGIAALAFVVAFVPIDLMRSASGVFRTGVARLAPGTHILFHQDGKTATVDVLDTEGLRAIRTNGKTDAAIIADRRRPPTEDEMTMALLAMMPLTQVPGAQTAAVIGFGSGMSTDVMLRSPNIRRVDTVEIEPAMVQGARMFLPVVAGAFDDPRSHIVIDDAKSYFARSRTRYDIIVSEPSNPWVTGVASLFTEEFYRRLALSLKDGGVLSQWLHTYEMDSATFASILDAVAKTFPDFVVYSADEQDLVLIARKGRPVADPDLRLLQWPAMAPIVARLKLSDPAVLRRRTFGSSASVLALFRPMAVAANSDYRPFVEQRTSRTRFTQERVTELLAMQASDMPLLEMFDGTFQPADHPVDSIPTTVPERAALDAWAFRKLLLHPSAPPGPAPSSDSPEHGAHLIALWAASCPADVRFDRLLPSMVAMAQMINPQVDRKSAEEVWRVLGESACARRLSPAQRDWLELFDAVAARDAARMSRVGMEVLDASRGRRDTATAYAFEAATAGLVCQHRFAEANQLFSLGTRDWLPPGNASVSLRYLYALANLPPGAPWPAGEDCKAH